MGRVPLNLAKVPQRKVGMPLPTQSMAKIEGERVVSKTIAAGIMDLGKMGAAYAQQNKDVDIKADEAAFSMFTKSRMAQADEAAGMTADPDEVRRIYSDAETEIADYVTGKTDGTPNIKWKDHQESLRNSVMQMKGNIAAIAGDRVLKIYKADTKAKYENVVSAGIAQGDMNMISEGTDGLVQSGIMTTEQGKSYVATATQKMYEYDAERRFDVINAGLADRSISPGAALDAAEGYVPSPSLDPARLNRVEKKISETKRAATVALLADMSESDMNTSDAIPILPQTDAEMAEAVQARINEKDPTKAKMFQAAGYSAFIEKIRQYDDTKDKDGSSLRTLMRESMAFGEYGDRARDRLLSKVRGDEVGKMGKEQKEDIYNRVYNLFDGAQDRAKSDDPRTQDNITVVAVDPTGKEKTISVSQAYLQLANVTGRILDEMTYSEALEMLESHPVYMQLKKTTDMRRYLDSLEKFDRPGQRWFGEPYQERPF